MSKNKIVIPKDVFESLCEEIRSPTGGSCAGTNAIELGYDFHGYCFRCEKLYTFKNIEDEYNPVCPVCGERVSICP